MRILEWSYSCSCSLIKQGKLDQEFKSDMKSSVQEEWLLILLKSIIFVIRKASFIVSFFCLVTWIKLLRGFFFLNHRWKFIFFKFFFCIYWDDFMIFILHFINVVYHINWFVDVEPLLHPWNRAYLIMICDSFKVMLNLVCYYFLDDFGVYAHQG